MDFERFCSFPKKTAHCPSDSWSDVESRLHPNTRNCNVVVGIQQQKKGCTCLEELFIPAVRVPGTCQNMWLLFKLQSWPSDMVSGDLCVSKDHQQSESYVQGNCPINPLMKSQRRIVAPHQFPHFKNPLPLQRLCVSLRCSCCAVGMLEETREASRAQATAIIDHVSLTTKSLVW